VKLVLAHFTPFHSQGLPNSFSHSTAFNYNGDWLMSLHVSRRVMFTVKLAYMLNTRSKERNTVFYSYLLACFMNTVNLKMYVFLSSIGLTRQSTVFVFLWLRPRNP